MTPQEEEDLLRVLAFSCPSCGVPPGHLCYAPRKEHESKPHKRQHVSRQKRADRKSRYKEHER